MKSFMILFLLVFSIILIPSVFGMPISSDKEPDILTITTDKPKYYENEMLNITCEMSVPVSYSSIWEMISPNNDVIIITNYVTNDNLIYNNLTFCYKIILDKELMDGTGSYKIKVSYDPNYDNTSIIETTFEYYDKLQPIVIQTDKQGYYIDDIIIINGTITKIDWSEDTTITYDITYLDNIIQTGNSNSLQNDGTFEFTIDTSTWNTDAGRHQLKVTIQNDITVKGIIYYNTIDMTPEANYEKIIIQEFKDVEHDTKLDIQNTTMQEYDTMMYTQQEEIVQIKDEQTDQRSFIDMILLFLGLSGEPPQSDPPIIISLVADDPDDLDDVYSIEDVIIIQFDSDTNEPGGDGMQTKSEVNDLFTFSENISQAYNGQWVLPDTFVITINSPNKLELIIGTTRVTPAGIIPILPADHTPDPSYLISPVLTGDWGILLPAVYTSEPQLKCGAGTYLDRGACIIINDTSLCRAGTELINGYCKVL